MLALSESLPLSQGFPLSELLLLIGADELL
jgi:hypothetical protein